MLIYGIDPGASTGLAVFDGGRLLRLETHSPESIMGVLAKTPPRLLIFEDSRLQQHVWSRGVTARVMQKVSRDIGRIDAWCIQLEALCIRNYIDFLPVSPRAKGSKLSAKEFKAFTGWRERCNQHERDAAMVAWPFRSMRSSSVRRMTAEKTHHSNLIPSAHM
jgi:hypothetical protein